jgi:hypothetical protein
MRTSEAVEGSGTKTAQVGDVISGAVAKTPMGSPVRPSNSKMWSFDRLVANRLPFGPNQME